MSSSSEGTTTNTNAASGSSDVKNSKPLPPGMVLGPDGKPCKICTAFRYWEPSGKKKTQSAGASSSTTSNAAAATTTAAATVGGEADQSRPAHCPPDVEQLGRATWTFLHTTAAYYPTRPTPLQRANMLNLLHSLPTLYPCGHCGEHLGKEMKTNPPDVSGREGLGRWLCERHDEVNVRLGKERFGCGEERLRERWRDGPKDGSCD